MSDTGLLVSQKYIKKRAEELLEESRQQVYQRTDFMFAWLLLAQWLAGIIAAVVISPRTWIGAVDQVHWHVWAAFLLGGSITAFPVFLAFRYPGKTLTRHVVAVSQLLLSALLIHLTGGRIETHFHIFGSLAFLAFYRDWRVLVTATVVIAVDHLARGLFWPQSVFGVLTASSWRWVEHAGWVLFENAFLLLAIRQSLRDMTAVAEHRAGLEAVNTEVESQVEKRTAELLVANLELQRREERLRKLSASAPIGIFETDASGQCLYTNPCWQNITGLSLVQGLGAGWLQAVHPDDAEHFHANWRACLRDATDFYGEFRFRRPVGEVRWVRARSAVVRTPTGGVIGHVGTIEDITKQKQADVELRNAHKELLASEERFGSAFEHAAIGMALVGPTGTWLKVNRALCQALGYTAAELQQKTFQEITHPDDLAADLLKVKQVWAGEIPSYQMEKRYFHQHGHVVWVLLSVSLVREEQGAPGYFIAQIQDISQRKQAEREVEKSNRDLIEASRQAGMAEVATGILHNVGNVLNSVNVASTCVANGIRKSRVSSLARVAALLREHETDLGTFVTQNPQGKMIPGYLGQLADHLATEQTRALGELAQLQKNIEHIRDIVTMQQGFAKVSGTAEPVQLPELLEDALQMNATALHRHDIQIIKEFATVPAVTTQKHKVLQILVNLIRNAQHACEDSGRDDKQMTLRLMQAADRVRISVTDNGVGIPPENLTRIFNHGFTTKKNGHGFGLHSGAIAVKEMGGALEVHSAGLGKGATFTVELPLKSAEDYDV